MGFKREDLKKIEDANLSSSPKSNLKNLEFENAETLSILKEYKVVSDEIYTVPCFWLDILLLRKENEMATVTEDLIESSKEIRLATKWFIKKEFSSLIEKMKDIPKEALELSLVNNLFNPIIPVKAIWENSNLKGFKLLNVKRENRLSDITVREMHKNIVSKQIREAVNLDIPI